MGLQVFVPILDCTLCRNSSTQQAILFFQKKIETGFGCAGARIRECIAGNLLTSLHQ